MVRALKEHHVKTVGGSDSLRLRVYAPDGDDEDSAVGKAAKATGGTTTPTSGGAASGSSTGRARKIKKPYFKILALKAVLQHVIVAGFHNVHRAVVNEETAMVPRPGAPPGSDDMISQKQYYLLVEGYGLREVMGCAGIVGSQTKSNHIVDMLDVCGIEAARLTIASEIHFIMSSYGITVDSRHLLLLADIMTFRGEVLGITRFGVAKMRESVLMLASFEKTTDHLFDAAVHARQDAIVGISECIIMGVPVPIGTGLFKLLHKAKKEVTVAKRTPLLSKYTTSK